MSEKPADKRRRKEMAMALRLMNRTTNEPLSEEETLVQAELNRVLGTGLPYRLGQLEPDDVKLPSGLDALPVPKAR